MDGAERATGISNQQVSRWRKHLSTATERAKYRAKMVLAARRKAELEAAS